MLLVITSSIPSRQTFAFNPNFELHSKAIYLLNLDTDRDLFSKNAHEKMYPASLTKIMTYLITVENVTDINNTNVVIKKDLLDSLLGTGSSMSNIKSGDTLSIKQLLQCLMISSGNDAALILADFVGNGDINKFVELMNQKAVKIGCENTHFANPHGLEAPDHFTTAYDLSLITKEALKYPEFLEISSTITTCYREGDDNTFLVTTNKLINPNEPDYFYTYAKGIKTGHCDESGYCLASMASYDGMTYLCITLGAPSTDAAGNDIKVHGEMLDSKNLYRWAFLNFSVKPLSTTSKPITSVKLNYAWKQDQLILTVSPASMVLIPDGVSTNDLDVVPEKIASVDAPLKKGQKVSTAKIYYKGQYIGDVDLISDSDVKESKILHTFSVIKHIITSKWTVTTLMILIALIIIYLILIYIYRKQEKRKKYIQKKYKYHIKRR